MKKVLCLLLSLLLILQLGACAPQAEPEAETPETPSDVQAAPEEKQEPEAEPLPEEPLQAGFGRADITPQEPVPMNGYSSSAERISTGTDGLLYAIAVAVTDSQGNTAILMSVDNAALNLYTCGEVRLWAKKTYDIPLENILISSIHQHSCPDPYSSILSSGRYEKLLLQGMKDAITAALEDRAPAELYVNTVTTEALSFVRHYWTKAGTITGDNYGDPSSGLVSHESESDKEMRLVKFDREDKNDIIMVNFQAHPHLGTSGSSTIVHADWPGVLRKSVSRRLEADVIYFSGAGGNLNSSSRIESENITQGKHFTQHGTRAADYVVEAEGSYTKVRTGPVLCRQITVTCDADHSMDHLFEQANQVHTARGRSTQEAYQVLANYPELHSIYHATAIVGKYKAAATLDIQISVITFGDVAFTSHPYEMFDTNGMELRAGTVGNENYDADDQL